MMINPMIIIFTRTRACVGWLTPVAPQGGGVGVGGGGGSGGAACVSRPFPSWNRSIDLRFPYVTPVLVKKY
jgi:hypothetical protein